MFAKKNVKNNNADQADQVDVKVGSKAKPKEKKKKNKDLLKVPKTVQDSIPYIGITQDGIMELEPGIYSKTYKFEDINFKTATNDEQKIIFEKYSDLLNMFDSDVRLELTIYDKKTKAEISAKNLMLEYKMDNLNQYREEYNKMLIDKMKEGRNNIVKDKYFTVTIKAKDIDEAYIKMSKIDSDINLGIKSINHQDTIPMQADERLEVLHQIYSADEDEQLCRDAIIDGKKVTKFDYKQMQKQGLSTKDLIAPSEIEFSPKYVIIDGKKYAQTFYIKSLPSYISASILPEITDINAEMLLSVHYNKLRADRAQKLIKTQLLNINSNVVDAQKNAVKSGFDPSLISPELKRAQEEAELLMTDISQRNQSLILTTFAITIFGESPEELNTSYEMLRSIVGKYICEIGIMSYQQEKAFNTSLPIGRCDIFTDRLLTTESAAIFIPFSSQELFQRNGMYYGLNAVSKNLILWNRKNSKNMNGLIFGTPGSGKSFSAKREMVNVILNTEDDIYIIDPEREYTPLAEHLGGTIIKIQTGGTVYLNPLDMDMNYGKDDDDANINPIAMKVDYIAGLFEAMAGRGTVLTSNQLSILDRCVTSVYTKYVQHMRDIMQKDPSITTDTKYSPTLKDLYELLTNQPEYEAQSLALCAERFCIGSLDNFAHHTNININNRFIVYDIKDMGDAMKELGLKVCLNAIWNQTITNKGKGKYTWFYVDEAHLLIQSPSSASYINQIIKRARKWYGLPCLITQNVADFLLSREACTIISNCDFIMMLNQSQSDKLQLAQLLNISPVQMTYITNADPGHGLIYNGKGIIPFVDRFPTDTNLYRIMSTKPSDLIAEKKAQN